MISREIRGGISREIRGGLPHRRRWIAFVAGFAAAAALAAAHAPPAGAFIYWVNSGPTSIGRANLDGTGVNQNFIPGNVAIANGSIAVDSTHIYWTLDSPIDASDVIRRANLNGSGVDPDFAPVPGDDPFGLALSNTHVFYGTGSGVKAVRKSDGAVQNCLSAPLLGVQDLAVSATNIYWAGSGAFIGRAGINCGGVDEQWLNVTNPLGVAVNNSHVFWTDDDDDVGRAQIDGSPGSVDNDFIAAPNRPFDVDVHGTQIYWTNQNADTIGRSDLSGSIVDQAFIDGSNGPGFFPSGVVADSLQPSTGGGGGGGGDTTPPGLELTGKAKQKSPKKVKVDVRCDEACQVEAGGSVKVPKVKSSSATASAKKRFDLGAASASLGSGQTQSLTLKLKKKAAKQTRKALKKGKKSTASVDATATDGAGNASAPETLKVKIKK